MIKTTIHLLVATKGCVLMIYYTTNNDWQFRIISPWGNVYGEQKLYQTAEAAERVARKWICTER